jgi:LuxR family maltose regulon positive regulatory protein
VASLHAAGNVVDELSSTILLADMWLVAGHPSRARSLCEQALGTAEAHGIAVARAAVELHVALSELDVHAGDLAGARRHLAAAAGLVDRVGMTEGSYRRFVAMAELAAAEGDLEQAVTHLGEAERLYRPGFFPGVRPIPATRARIRIRQGDLEAAGDWARDQGVTVDDDPAFLREYEHLTLVRLLLARHRANPAVGPAQDALALLGRLLAVAEPAGRGGSVLEIRLLQALARDALGDRPAALAVLAGALTAAAEPEGSARLLLDEGAAMTGLLRELQRQGLADDLPGRIRSREERSPTALAPRGTPEPLADPLSGRELEVLRLLDGELTGPEIARQLFVSHNTLRSHTKHIFTKLDVTSRRSAVVRARELGLI